MHAHRPAKKEANLLLHYGNLCDKIGVTVILVPLGHGFVGGVHHDLYYDFTAAGRPHPRFGGAVSVRQEPGSVRHDRRHRG